MPGNKSNRNVQICYRETYREKIIKFYARPQKI